MSGNCKPKVLVRDGHKMLECMKGDPYINDVANTCTKVCNHSRFWLCLGTVSLKS